MVRQIFQWSLEGRGKQEIARMLNDRGIPNPAQYKLERGWTAGPPGSNQYGLWNKTTIWRMLHNEMYTGVMLQGRRKKASYKSKTMLPVPEDQWYRVEAVSYTHLIGRAAFELAAPAIAMGGNVRVGFEDNLYLSKGVLAKSNGELVKKVADLAALLGRPVATPAEARGILGLRK